jgi:hypothetical protein
MCCTPSNIPNRSPSLGIFGNFQNFNFPVKKLGASLCVGFLGIFGDVKREYILFINIIIEDTQPYFLIGHLQGWVSSKMTKIPKIPKLSDTPLANASAAAGELARPDHLHGDLRCFPRFSTGNFPNASPPARRPAATLHFPCTAENARHCWRTAPFRQMAMARTCATIEPGGKNA